MKEEKKGIKGREEGRKGERKEGREEGEEEGREGWSKRVREGGAGGRE